MRLVLLAAFAYALGSTCAAQGAMSYVSPVAPSNIPRDGAVAAAGTEAVPVEPMPGVPREAPMYVQTGTSTDPFSPQFSVNRLVFEILATLLYPFRMLFLGIFLLVAEIFSTPIRFIALVIDSILLFLTHVFAPVIYIITALETVFVKWPMDAASTMTSFFFPLYIIVGTAVVMGGALGSFGVLLLAAEHTVYSIRIRTRN